MKFLLRLSQNFFSTFDPSFSIYMNADVFFSLVNFLPSRESHHKSYFTQSVMMVYKR